MMKKSNESKQKDQLIIRMRLVDKLKVQQIAERINLTPKAVSERIRFMKKKGEWPGDPSLVDGGLLPEIIDVIASPERRPVGLTETELRKKHDNTYKLSEAVKKLEKGIYVPDPDFINQCGISQHAGYRRILERPEFDAYHGKASGMVYWSHPDSIRKMKLEGILT